MTRDFVVEDDMIESEWHDGSPEDFVNPYTAPTWWVLEMADGFVVAEYAFDSEDGLAYLFDLNTAKVITERPKRHTQIERLNKWPVDSSLS